jgi:putative flippase GtrA
MADLRGTLRVPQPCAAAPVRQARPLSRQLARFLEVGVASTLAYVLLYLGLRTALPAQAANAVSLLATAVLNTAVNRRFTFGIRGRPDLARHQAQGLLAFGAGLALTSAALAALHAAVPRPARAAEVTVLIGANLAATAIRFAIYRHWVFRRRRATPDARSATCATGRPSQALYGKAPLATVPSPATETNGHHQ